MPISGLILTLEADSAKHAEAINTVSKHPALCIGEQQQQKLPLVLDTKSKEENKQMLGWLESIRGVEYIDVVYVSLEEDTEVEPNSTLYKEKNIRLMGARS